MSLNHRAVADAAESNAAVSSSGPARRPPASSASDATQAAGDGDQNVNITKSTLEIMLNEKKDKLKHNDAKKNETSDILFAVASSGNQSESLSRLQEFRSKQKSVVAVSPASGPELGNAAASAVESAKPDPVSARGESKSAASNADASASLGAELPAVAGALASAAVADSLPPLSAPVAAHAKRNSFAQIVEQAALEVALLTPLPSLPDAFASSDRADAAATAALNADARGESKSAASNAAASASLAPEAASSGNQYLARADIGLEAQSLASVAYIDPALYREELFADRSHYEGEWCSGKFHGYGTYTFADGSCYEGQWNHGQKNGYGKHAYQSGGASSQYSWSAGDTYDGEWKAHKRHGAAVYTWSNGVKLACVWAEGQCEQWHLMNQKVLGIVLLNPELKI